MKRYLLFDAGCAACTALARSVERESQGWLEARSLREPEVQAYVQQTARSMRWEPTLLEVTDQGVQIFTGWALQRKLLFRLGLRRTARILLLVESQPSGEFHPQRRQFFRWSGTALGTMALGLAWRQGSHKFTAPSSEKELAYQVTTLSAGEGKQLFEGHPLVQLSRQHFGEVDWNRMNHFLHRESGDTFFEIPLVSDSGTTSWLGLKDAATTKGMVLQMHTSAQTDLTYDLFLPDGQLAASFTLNHGQVEQQVIPTAPAINLNCVYACLGVAVATGDISVSCVNVCVSCATGGGAIIRAVNCLQCSVCAHGPIWNCLKNCGLVA